MVSEQKSAHSQSMVDCYDLIEAGETLSARNQVKTALKNKDKSPTIHATLTGLYYLLDNAPEQAIASFKTAIVHDNNNLEAHYYLAKSCLLTGALTQAVKAVSCITSLDKTHAKAWFLHSSIAKKQNNIPAFRDYLLKAIEYDIDNSRYWRQLQTLTAHSQARLPPGLLSKLTAKALQRHQLDPLTITPFIHYLLKTNVSLKHLNSLLKNKTLTLKQIIGLLNDELLLAIMQGTILYGPNYEILFTELRKALLTAVSKQTIASADTDKAITCISALSIYCLATEFVFYISDDEYKLLDQCKHNINNAQSNSKQAALFCAITGCYEPLFDNIDTSIDIRKLEQDIDNTQFCYMIFRHIYEKEKECACKEVITSARPIKDNVSQSVQQHYEENPYPRWISWGAETPVTLDRLLINRFPYLEKDQLPNIQSCSDQPVDILIAGCGTGRNAIMAAKGFYNSNVLAVDLSKASLAYATMKADEFGINNITFLQGDLLDLPSLNRKFDMVDSSGVLHHMHDPQKGLAAIDKCLKPGGWMKIALYSHIARKTIRQARDEIKKLGIETTAAGIRDFRRQIINDSQHPLHELCTIFRDFYSMSECKDLLFHVQEHQFTTDQLQDLILPFNLEFMGFEQVDSALNAKESPITDPQSFKQWGALEEANPMLFAGMYHLWLRKPKKFRFFWSK